MARSNRMFEIIQLLRRARRPMTADGLAEALEVTPRTIYRDVAALQSMRVPIEGAAGIGYVMRAGFDLPPLMFDADEIEAIVVGMALLHRTGDKGLRAAAGSVSGKIADVLPKEVRGAVERSALHVSKWGAQTPSIVDLKALRAAIRDERKLRVAYLDEKQQRSRRTIRPIAVLYYVEVVVLAAWCELRRDFRHFRLDRITACKILQARFAGEGAKLRADWEALHALP